jgi:hypothetical protein
MSRLAVPAERADENKTSHCFAENSAWAYTPSCEMAYPLRKEVNQLKKLLLFTL